VSTRGQAPAVTFSDAILNGLAPDGGLYLPDAWPQVSAAEIEGFATAPYPHIARTVLGRFVDAECPQGDALDALLAEAYGTFRHDAVVPVIELDTGLHVLEL